MERLGAGADGSGPALLVAEAPVGTTTAPNVADDDGPAAHDGSAVHDSAAHDDFAAHDDSAAHDDFAAHDEMLPRWVRHVGWSLLGLQLVAMVAFSTVEYSRYALTEDFANYSQAWWSIGHGHLDPFITGLGVSFWRDNAEFILYPLALLYRVWPHPVTLLWVQDVAVVATELVAFRWILAAIGRARGRISTRTGLWLGLGAAVVLVADPWVYDTIAFDFHFEPIAALFCVLAGYNLWAGRIRRLWWLVPLALVSHVLAGTYLVGVGLSGILAGPRTRRPGAVIAAVGLAWTLVFTAVGAAGVQGEFVNKSYGYLAPAHHGRIGMVALVTGALGHPVAVLQVAASHWTVVVAFLVVVGAIGVLSPWGFGPALLVLAPNVLDNTGLFIRSGASFQSWPALPFVLVGSIMVLLRLFEGGQRRRRLAAVILVVWATVLAELSILDLPTIPGSWIVVDAPAAAVLARVSAVTPPNAEVIASQGIIGRFAQRQSVYDFRAAHQTFPVNRRVVVFVFGPPDPYEKALTRSLITGVSGFVHHHLGARVIGSESAVHAFAWSPPPGTTTVTLP